MQEAEGVQTTSKAAKAAARVSVPSWAARWRGGGALTLSSPSYSFPPASGKIGKSQFVLISLLEC